MNTYLLNFATQIPRIRQLLNWTQDDLARRTGISRSTIVAIENDPGKLLRYMAMAIFVAVSAELHTRKQTLAEIDWSKGDFLSQLSTLGLNSRVVNSIFPSVVGLIGGAIEATAFRFVPRIFSKSTPTQDIDAEKLKAYVETSILFIDRSILSIFGIELLDSAIFMKKIEEGEVSED